MLKIYGIAKEQAFLNEKRKMPRKGYRQSPEHRAKISKANRGRTYTPETRAKLSEANVGENNPMQGKTHTPETRAKISKANQGKTYTLETKDAMSVAQTSKQRLLSQEDLEELLEEAREKTPVFETRNDEYFGDIGAEGQLLKDVRGLINTIPRMDKIEDGMTATTFQYYLETLRTIRGRLKNRASNRKRKTKPATQ